MAIAYVGHMPNLERPAEFNAALQRFLSTLPSRRPLTLGRERA